LATSVSPVSKLAAVLIIAVGLLTLVFINAVAGLLFVILGVFLYRFLYRFTARIEREASGEGGGNAPDKR
jgi:membrane protein implicated in regulation of membrane protease activity